MSAPMTITRSNLLGFTITSQRLLIPEEVLLQIFTALLEGTDSSASLVPPSRTCSTFRRILFGTPQLWTRIRVDGSFAVRETSIPGCADWPMLDRLLGLSEKLLLSLHLDFRCASRDHNAKLLQMLERGCFHRLIKLLDHRQALFRCTNITVWCSTWDLLIPIAEYLDDLEYPLTYIESVTLRCDHYGHTYRPEHPPRDDLSSSLIEGSVERSVALTPFLAHVVLDSFPIDYQCFSPCNLTSLTLNNVPKGIHSLTWGDLSFVLKMNERTLTQLHLGVGAVPSQVEAGVQVPLNLPQLSGLSIEYTDPAEMYVLAHFLVLPKLRLLYIQNSANSGGSQNSHEMIQYTHAVYETMKDRWPLPQVIHLRMSGPAFYDVEENPISKLEQYYLRGMAWKDRFPLASDFFYQFHALQILELYQPDQNTLKTLLYPPVILNSSGQPGIRKYFPNLRRHNLQQDRRWAIGR
ncbi:hypothetical protein Moror_1650 [Moniliophthora roreri MCA 2997]|uniref:F-box domain-containing protein n=1 Tax=Moniliophthora roreri (strain MCA 2997) TaxID=1381753 RepID=V2X303_MONRO|nr:hypothetical protein Moror_1650 [Moniliophthora roreri MCA 2997]